MVVRWLRFAHAEAIGRQVAIVRPGGEANTLVKTTLNGDVRQEFPVSDTRLSAAQLVHRISRGMTLFRGDFILCGTSLGVGSMKPGSTVED